MSQPYQCALIPSPAGNHPSALSFCRLKDIGQQWQVWGAGNDSPWPVATSAFSQPNFKGMLSVPGAAERWRVSAQTASRFLLESNNKPGSVLSPWFSCWSGQEPACMERGGKQVLYTKHPCSAALWAVALCSARRVQSPLSIARVELATGRHSSARHFYPRENWKMLPSPTLLNGQLKAWEYILTLLKPVAGLPWISAMQILHLLRARRGRALNCGTTEKSLCLCWKKSWKSK